MDISAVEQTCHKGCGWREAYMRQTEIVKAMMEESDQVFLKTRDMVLFLNDIYGQATEQKPDYTNNKKSSRRRYKYD